MWRLVQFAYEMVQLPKKLGDQPFKLESINEFMTDDDSVFYTDEYSVSFWGNSNRKKFN